MSDHVPHTVEQVMSQVRERLTRLRELQERQIVHDLNPVETPGVNEVLAIRHSLDVILNAHVLLARHDVDILYAWCVAACESPVDPESITAAERLDLLDRYLPKLIAEVANYRDCGFSKVSGVQCFEFIRAVREMRRKPTLIGEDASGTTGSSPDSEPGPLQETVDRLVPLVHWHLEWWRSAVLRWAADPPHYFDKKGIESGVVPVSRDSHITLTADDRIVLLAAIYDTYAVGGRRIYPWSVYLLPGGPDLSDQGLTAWGVALARVPLLRDYWPSYRALLETSLDDVEQQLESLRAKAIALPKRNNGDAHDATADLPPRFTSATTTVDQENLQQPSAAHFGRPAPLF